MSAPDPIQQGIDNTMNHLVHRVGEGMQTAVMAIGNLLDEWVPALLGKCGDMLGGAVDRVTTAGRSALHKAPNLIPSTGLSARSAPDATPMQQRAPAIEAPAQTKLDIGGMLKDAGFSMQAMESACQDLGRETFNAFEMGCPSQTVARTTAPGGPAMQHVMARGL